MLSDFDDFWTQGVSLVGLFIPSIKLGEKKFFDPLLALFLPFPNFSKTLPQLSPKMVEN